MEQLQRGGRRRGVEVAMKRLKKRKGENTVIGKVIGRVRIIGKE